MLWTLGMIRNEVLQMPSAPPEPVRPVAEDDLVSAQEVDAIGADALAKATQSLYKHADPSNSEVPGLPTHVSDMEVSRGQTLATVMSQQVPSSSILEINQSIAVPAASLNDVLRQDQPELSQRLRPEALLDLRQAVGINDRFRFINELFLGDAALFDQAIGALNDLPNYMEAALWIEQSLPAARTWNPDDALVRQFHGLLRSRFE